jgi:hypothetical protein
MHKLNWTQAVAYDIIAVKIIDGRVWGQVDGIPERVRKELHPHGLRLKFTDPIYLWHIGRITGPKPDPYWTLMTKRTPLGKAMASKRKGLITYLPPCCEDPNHPGGKP